MRSFSSEVKGKQGRSKLSEEKKGGKGNMDTKKNSKAIIKYNICVLEVVQLFQSVLFLSQIWGKILMPIVIIFFLLT